MLTPLLLGSLVTAASPGTCGAVAEVRGDDAAAVAELSEALARAGISTDATTAPCQPVEVRLEGRGPYVVRVPDHTGRLGRWTIHLVEMAVPLVESAAGLVRLPERPIEESALALAMTARSEVSVDSSGTMYAGPALRASLCAGIPCLDAVGHFGLGLVTQGLRSEVAFGLGGSLQRVDASDGWAVDLGATLGGRWVREVLSQQVEPPLAWTIAAYPYTDVEVQALQLAAEIYTGVRGRLFDDVALDAQMAVALIPDGEQRPRYNLTVTSAFVVRLSVGLRWDVAP